MKSDDVGRGAQLALAVALSYALSRAAGLPEGYWAVMSALIVSRPDMGATLGAGWQRIQGTALGTVFGLLGAWLVPQGPSSSVLTLAIVSLLAFASAGRPLFRAAPMTALIIVSSGRVAGHSALEVAALRVAEIGIGVAVGLAISVAWPIARARARFNTECAGVLRGVAEQLRATIAKERRSDEDREAATAAMRAALRQLVLLADSAAQESRLSLAAWRGRWRAAPKDTAESIKSAPHRRIASLVMRTSQDTALLGRVFDSNAAALPEGERDPLWRELREAACASLESAAQAFNNRAQVDQAPLGRVDALLEKRRSEASTPDEAALLLAGPLRWLLEDLRALGRVAAVINRR